MQLFKLLVLGKNKTPAARKGHSPFRAQVLQAAVEIQESALARCDKSFDHDERKRVHAVIYFPRPIGSRTRRSHPPAARSSRHSIPAASNGAHATNDGAIPVRATRVRARHARATLDISTNRHELAPASRSLRPRSGLPSPEQMQLGACPASIFDGIPVVSQNGTTACHIPSPLRRVLMSSTNGLGNYRAALAYLTIGAKRATR